MEQPLTSQFLMKRLVSMKVSLFSFTLLFKALKLPNDAAIQICCWAKQHSWATKKKIRAVSVNLSI